MFTKTILFATTVLIGAATASPSNFRYHSSGDNWGHIHATCGSGDKQSPIDIKDSEVTLTDANVFDLNGHGYQNYAKNMLKYKHNTVQVDVKDGTFWAILPDGEKHWFKPAQFHFHSPSEHTFNGKQYDLEMHFVHSDTT